MLAATYGICGERISQQLADVAGKLVADYWDNNGGDIRAIVDGTLLMDYDEAGVEMHTDNDDNRRQDQGKNHQAGLYSVSPAHREETVAVPFSSLLSTKTLVRSGFVAG